MKEYSTQVVGTGFYQKVADIFFAAGTGEGQELLSAETLRRGFIKLFAQRYGWEEEECNAFLREACMPELSEGEFDELVPVKPAPPVKKGERTAKAENGEAKVKPARQRMAV